jgi:peptidoglycan/LPS O-acetylase OafA/YrhL
MMMDSGNDRRQVSHFYCIDLLRGLSSIAVLIFHYNHFYHPPYGVVWDYEHFQRAAMPLYWLLWPFYEHGHYAVQLFWLISGFVFAHVYYDSKITAKEFALRRFARLYPLHAVTLLATVAIQGVSLATTGMTQIIANYDLKHFIYSVFFITPALNHGALAPWGVDVSFNAPVWSVTVEEAIYAVFFILCAFLFTKRSALPLIMATFCVMVALTSPKLELFAVCGFYFFTGSLTYYLIMSRKVTLTEAIGATAGLIGAIFLGLRIVPEGITALNEAAALIKVSVVFVPALIVAALIDLSPFGRHLHRLRWIGDNTYSMYLWHWPLEVAILTFLWVSGINRSFLASPIMIIAWIAVMLVVGRVSLLWIERPAQKAILGFGMSRIKATPYGASNKSAPLRVAPVHEGLRQADATLPG